MKSEIEKGTLYAYIGYKRISAYRVLVHNNGDMFLYLILESL